MAQLAALHTHAPPTQARPAPQAAPVPHLQVPPLQVSAVAGLHAEQAAPPLPQVAVELAWHTPLEQHPLGQLPGPQPLQALPTQVCGEGQLWHAPPAAPHAAVWVPAWHWLLAQHPVGQLAALQMHAPPTQRWPAPQAGVLPQLQAPVLQLSEVAASQAAHAAPAAPHCAAEGVTHWLLLQQPLVQLVASHTQAPALQRNPAPQAGPAPQPHAPAVQESVASFRQEVHTAPPRPHAAWVGTWQAPLKQQPLGQLSALHPSQVPPVQAPPPAQLWQDRPPLPHWSEAVPTAQNEPSQQPPQVLGPQPEAPPVPPPSPPPLTPPPAPPPTPPPPPPLALAPPPSPPPSPLALQTESTQRLGATQSASVVQA